MRPAPPCTGPLTELVIGITPFCQPDAGLAEAVCRAGGLGVLDLGVGDRRAREQLAALRERLGGGFGVRVGPGCGLLPGELSSPSTARPETVVLAGEVPGWDMAAIAAEHRLLVEVTELGQAVARCGPGHMG